MSDSATAPVSDFRLPVRVYYEDTDAGGVVYYANYLKYFERARTEWLRTLGFDQSRLAREWNLLFAVRSMEVDYRWPARLDDLIEVVMPPPIVRRASLDFEQAVRRVDDGAALCEARVRIACLDAETFRPRGLPQALQEDFP